MEENQSSHEQLLRHQTVDPAALAGAAIAAALAVFSVPGPFMPMNLVVGLTLVTILLTYELRRYRDNWQNYAFGAALMIVGFLTELHLGGWQLNYWEELVRTEPRKSRVNEWYLLICWLVLTGIFTFCGFKGRITVKTSPTR